MKVIINLLLATIIVAQSGCVPMLIGTVATATAVGMQDKSLGTTIDDTTIMIRINKELFEKKLFSSVKVKVNEGRVLLLGNVDSIEKQITAQKVAWDQRGVKEVINQISIKLTDNSSITDVTNDSLITTKIKAKILAGKNIKSINYSVNTVDGIVYLMGIAQNSKELNDVIMTARRVKGVKRVVSYVRLID